MQAKLTKTLVEHVKLGCFIGILASIDPFGLWMFILEVSCLKVISAFRMLSLKINILS